MLKKPVVGQNLKIVMPFCTGYFANCDQRQKISIFELILSINVWLKKLTKYGLEWTIFHVLKNFLFQNLLGELAI